MKIIPWDRPDISKEEIESVIESIKSGHLGGHGPNVRKLEKEFCNKIGVKHSIAVNNCTSALLVSLFALREYLGEELKVAVPSFTFIASANTSQIVGKALLTDCDKSTWNMTENNIPDEANVIMPVDVGGLPVNYDRLLSLGLPIIADSAESAGAKINGQYVGSQADIHCFSLHRAKIITAGEGGIITTNNDNLFSLLESWTNHGYDLSRKSWQYKHIRLSLNCRMTDLEASIALIQLKKLDYYVKKRREKAAIYRDVLGDVVEYQQEHENTLHPYFFFGILVPNDNNLICQKAEELGIGLKTWDPVHWQKHFKNKAGFFPNADIIGKRVVLLPIHNKLSTSDTIYIAEKVKNIILES